VVCINSGKIASKAAYLQTNSDIYRPNGVTKIDAHDATVAFQNLDPHTILDSIDSVGWQTDGRVSALNSYENRVYSVGLAVCLFPRSGGRPPELDNPSQLAVIGRTIARLHLVADTHYFEHRPYIDANRLGEDSADYLLNGALMPRDQAVIYESIIDELLDEVHAQMEHYAYHELCLHGDFHPGNILWGSDDTPHLLDFDDTATGPAMQDLWMFISGDRQYAQARLGDLLDGYNEFREFDTREIALIEPLRTLRIIHYAAWIARRWEDPAFGKAFPFFAEPRFWDDHIQSLREQRASLDNPHLIY